MRQHILVPYDGSESALSALQVAIDIAKKYEEKIILLNVQPDLVTPNTERYFEKSEVELYQKAQYNNAIKSGVQVLESLNIEFETKMILGNPNFVICEEAKARKIRYIVMGSRGHSTFVGGVLGSVSQRVLQLADCPVMIVPAPAQ